MSFAQFKNNLKTQKNQAVVTKSFLPNTPQLPLVYKPIVGMLDLTAWYQQNQSQVIEDLKEYGAVLFRGFKLDNQAQFKRFTDAAIDGRAAYIEGATPRTALADGIYTSTEFAKEQEIAPHNELSYVTNPPPLLAFCCLQSAATGGQTPLTDVANVAEGLGQGVQQQFADKDGWLLERHYRPGFGPTIEKAFGLDKLDDIKTYCDGADIELEQRSAHHMITRQKRPAMHRHPLSGQSVWFNHIAFWHPDSLCPKVRESLKGHYPFATRFGDGTEIDSQTIDLINQTYQKHEVVFDWLVGDVLLIDNWRVAHGRKPYTGDRKVLVAMGQIKYSL